MLMRADITSVCVGVYQSACIESRSTLAGSCCSCVEWTATKIIVSKC